jgi:uncharacterized iron-regulated membrane protein
MNENSTPVPRPKNWLLLKAREWHIWLGVAVSLFAVLICATGIYLNNEKLFVGGEHGMQKLPIQKGLSTVTDLDAIPVSFAQALARARKEVGEAPIEHIQLKYEKEGLAYKIKLGEGWDLFIDAKSGALTEKKGYRTKSEGSAGMTHGVNWGKVMKDLHTGKIGGFIGHRVADFTSLVLILLTVTGVYLWALPKWRRWKARGQRSTP